MPNHLIPLNLIATAAAAVATTTGEEYKL